jgi:ADP-ribose pyrophosphatase YjhB (NUDIX family)
VRELLEEGGVIGRAADLVGTSQVVVGDRRLSVSYYLVWYEADGQASDAREKAWLSFTDAHARLTFEDTRRFLAIVERLITPA